MTTEGDEEEVVEKLDLLGDFDVSVHYEEANGEVEHFNGMMSMVNRLDPSGATAGTRTMGLDIDNILLRGLTTQGDVAIIAAVVEVGMGRDLRMCSSGVGIFLSL